MQYLGLDVHVKSTVWHLLDSTGQTVETGKAPTTVPELRKLVCRLTQCEQLLVGQEVGKMAYLVHDLVTATGVKILSFNAWHLRMIASSRKKTDRRDAYWIAKALQTGMTPTPVYLPNGEVRELRHLISRRQAIVVERQRWLLRARSYLEATGHAPTRAHRSVPRLLETCIANPDGMDATLAVSVQLCQRMHATLSQELVQIDALLDAKAKTIDSVKRLQTIPAVGKRVALMIYAWVGDVTRFRNARELASYAGLVPSVSQSGESTVLGRITRTGSPQLRSTLVQSGHVLLWKCQSEHSAPLKAIAERVHAARARRKIAVVAAARHILRIAYYVLRDGTNYDPTRLRPAPIKGASSAALEVTPEVA